MKGLVGTRLGRYELRSRIAQGGMSEVYLAYDRRLRRCVAVKVLYGSNEAFIRRFEREAVSVGTLVHEHILPLYDFGEQRPWYYLVMPFVEGGTLRDYLYTREKLTLEEAGSFLEQIASSLQYAHDHGVMHRDVKPSNILLRLDGHAYLVDFGLAKAQLAADLQSHAGTMIGTPEYMAPEQSNGVHDYRSDIYSLGVILYQMLTGHVPFAGESPVAVTLKHLQVPPPAPVQFNSKISPAIEEVILKALAKNPEERYQQAKELSIAYKRALFQRPFHSILSSPSLSDAGRTRALLPSDSSVPQTPENSSRAVQLFPLQYKTPPLSLVAQQARTFKKRHLFVRLCYVLILLLVLPLPIFLLWRTQYVQRPVHHISVPVTLTKTAQSLNTTATANARKELQATLAAEARSQAVADITSAIGAGRVLYYNDMTRADGGWIDDGTQCSFSEQGYRVRTYLAHTDAWCYTNGQKFADSAISVQTQLLKGDFCGVVFRLDPNRKSFYVFEINSYGQYRLQRALGRDPTNWLTLIDWTEDSSIHPGYGQANTVLVLATETHFRFYINQQLVVSTYTDTAYRTGFIGLLVGGDAAGGTQAVFRNVTVCDPSH